MNSPLLSPGSEQRIALLFPPSEQDLVRSLLVEECGNNLPGLGRVGVTEMDRYRFAVLKLSEGNLNKLQRALQLAKTDWRDLLMAAGFGQDVTAHERWLPKQDG